MNNIYVSKMQNLTEKSYKSTKLNLTNDKWIEIIYCNYMGKK